MKTQKKQLTDLTYYSISQLYDLATDTWQKYDGCNGENHFKDYIAGLIRYKRYGKMLKYFYQMFLKIDDCKTLDNKNDDTVTFFNPWTDNILILTKSENELLNSIYQDEIK